MKTALLLLSLLASTAAAPRSRAHDVTWSEIHAFIVTEAVSVDPGTEAELWTESVYGEKTWEIAGNAARARRASPVDGLGLGWPKQGIEITFATVADAEECGAMIDEFRESQNR